MKPAKRVKKRTTKQQEAVAWALLRLERQGLIVSNLDPDGKVRWRITEKGRQAKPVEWEWEYSEEPLN